MWNCRIHGAQAGISHYFKRFERLEYRGYDSSGVALLNGAGLKVYKKKAKGGGTGRQPHRPGCFCPDRHRPYPLGHTASPVTATHPAFIRQRQTGDDP